MTMPYFPVTRRAWNSASLLNIFIGTKNYRPCYAANSVRTTWREGCSVHESARVTHKIGHITQTAALFNDLKSWFWLRCESNLFKSIMWHAHTGASEHVELHNDVKVAAVILYAAVNTLSSTSDFPAIKSGFMLFYSMSSGHGARFIHIQIKKNSPINGLNFITNKYISRESDEIKRKNITNQKITFYRLKSRLLQCER